MVNLALPYFDGYLSFTVLLAQPLTVFSLPPQYTTYIIKFCLRVCFWGSQIKKVGNISNRVAACTKLGSFKSFLAERALRSLNIECSMSMTLQRPK